MNKWDKFSCVWYFVCGWPCSSTSKDHVDPGKTLIDTPNYFRIINNKKKIFFSLFVFRGSEKSGVFVRTSSYHVRIIVWPLGSASFILLFVCLCGPYDDISGSDLCLLLYTDTQWVTLKCHFACSRAWSRSSTLLPCTTTALNMCTGSLGKNPVAYASTSSSWMRTVRIITISLRMTACFYNLGTVSACVLHFKHVTLRNIRNVIFPQTNPITQWWMLVQSCVPLLLR